MTGSAARDTAVPGALAVGWRGRLPRHRWRTWLAAAAAAAAIAVAVAVTLLAAGNAPPPAASASGVPEYYVALPPVPELGLFSSAATAVVGDTLTGKKVATVPAPAGLGFAGVAAAGDDRTFVLAVAPRSASHMPVPVRWYLLRLTPGAARPATLTQLPIPAQPLVADPVPMALSSDGTMLAIATGTEPAVAGLRVYSTATGLLLHAWSASSAELRGIEVVSPVSWTSGGHQLIFQTSASTTGPVVVRLLQADDPGHDMLADSRPVFTFMTRVGSPDNCIDGFAMAGNGRTVLCGSAAQVHEPASFGNKECPTYTHPVSTAIRQASAVTGKLTGTLYQAAVSCQTPGNLALFWVNDDGTAVLGNLLHSQAGPSGSTWKPIEQFGLFTRGKFTPLPAPLETSLGLPSITAW